MLSRLTIGGMFSRAIEKTALLLLGVAIGVCIQAARSDERKSSVSLDLGLSANRATPSPDGQWYQKDQDGTGLYKSTAGTFGASFYLNPAWTVGIHYVSLGRFHVDALAVAFPGDDRKNMTAGIDPLRAECRTPPFKAGCLDQWHTASYARGINLSTSFKMFEVEGVRFDAKVGLYTHKLTSAAIVEPLGCRDNCSWRVQVDQSAERISPMWGVVVRWKYLFASWESYERIGEHTPVTANIKGPVEVKTIGVRIPI